MKKNIFSIFIVFILLFNNTFTGIVYSVDDVFYKLNNLSSGFDDNIGNLGEKDDDIITEEVIYDDIDLDNKDDAELELQTLEDNELEDNTNDDIDLEDDLEVDENLEIISSGYNDDEIVDDEIIDENLNDIINEEVIDDIIVDSNLEIQNEEIQDEEKAEDISSTDDEVQELEIQDPLLDIQNNEEEKEQGFLSNLWEIIKSFFLEKKNGYLVGSEIIDNVTISIEAKEGILPDGTEVVIKGVPQDRFESIQTSLIDDETNKITEYTQILAFDISFVYGGEEIQPNKEISVKFNYKENLDFKGASQEELSVYHIDDVTDEGTEIQLANKNGDEIEILATEFSIYVLTLTQNDNITLTLDPGDGIIITGDNIVVDEYGIGTIISSDGDVILPDATREDHVFVGWYTSQTPSLQSFAGTGGNEYHINSDITLYASWCNDGYVINTDKTTCILEGNLKTILDQNPNFTYGQIGISKPDGWLNDEDPDIIVIMDRNLGASSFGINTNAWGYYYQWGNNYGFTQNPTIISRDIANVNLNLYGPGNPYYSGTFVIGYVNGTRFPTWATTQNYSIWGYNTDEDEDKQGPCPVGYHVPSITEWNRLVDYWTGNNGGMNILRFRSELGLPLAGGLTRSTAELESGGIHGWYRTVTPNISKEGWAYDFDVTNNNYSGNYSENLVNGRQIRCFLDKGQLLPTFTVIFKDGVDNREIFEDQIYSGLLMGDDFPQFSGIIPSRTGDNGVYHEFLGWLFEGTDISFDVSGATVNRSVSLYAKWSGCFNENEEANANGICVPTAEGQRNNQIVQDLEIYLLASDENKIHYTIMDRNMGATEVFNKYYTGPNPESLGYLYQWGNNYGFPAKGDLVEQGVFTRDSQVPKSIWSAGIPSNYASGVYYLNSADHASWMGSPTISDGIWGGTGDTRDTNGGDTTLEDRQGPCPVGYHIPSTLEWTTIFTDWSGSNIGISHTKVNNKIPAIYKFSEDLLLPPAGRRAANGVIGYENTLSYWSSSPATSNAVRADGLYAKPDDKIEIPNADGRARARSVRCVKNVINTSETSISTDDIHLDGGGNTVISIDNGVISTLGAPTRADSTFEGWYTTADFSGNALSTGDTVLPGSSLYAKFTCNDSGYVWNGTGCEGGVRLMFDSMGGTDVPMQVVTVGKTGTKPQDPTKTGYLFTGWYESGSDVEFNFVETIITGDITLYARWIISDVSYTVYHYLKDPGLATYSLYTSDEYTGSVGDVININNLAKNNIPCAVFTGGSTGFNNLGPSNTIETLTLEIGGSTGIYLYYTRNTYTLTLDKDVGIFSISGSGVYECGQTVTINAIPKTGYHFKRWDGVLDDSG